MDSGEAQLQTRLLEVIPFAQALLPRGERSEALNDVSKLEDMLVLGRCFLETQLYAHPEWKSYLTREQSYLATRNRLAWDKDWLRRLHLFSVVVRDARDWTIEVARKAIAPDLEIIFSGIVGSNREAVTDVFAEYVAQDAAAAIRLADHMGVDMLAEHPRTIVNSCQNWPFFSLAIEKAESDSTGRWERILAEAGLEFESVAYRLDSTRIVNLQQNELARRDKHIESLLWLCDIQKGTYYNNFLRRVLADAGQGWEDFPGISSFVSCMRQAYLFRVIYWVLVPVLAILGSCFLLAASPLLAQGLSGTIGGFIVVLTAVFLCGAGIWFRSWERALYRAIGNRLSPLHVPKTWPSGIIASLVIRRIMPAQCMALREMLAFRQDADATIRSLVGMDRVSTDDQPALNI